VFAWRGSMEIGSCCVLRPNTTASLDDDQIVPDHPGDCSSGGWASSGQSYLDTWLHMQVCYEVDPRWMRVPHIFLFITDRSDAASWLRSTNYARFMIDL
jgi:hypothetical protein